MGKVNKDLSGTFEIEQGNKHSDVRSVATRWGIYTYSDKKTGEVMYLGKDSFINKGNRRSTHQQYSRIDDQILHKKLLKHKDNLKYEVIAIVKDQDWLDDFEAALIFGLKAAGQCKWNVEDELEIGEEDVN